MVEGAENLSHGGAERRQHKRIEKQYVTRVNDRISGGWNIAFIRNISAGGLLFHYDKKLNPGALIDFKVSFGMAKEPIECVGKVLRVKAATDAPVYEIATVFVLIKETDSRLINRVAEELCSDKTEGIQNQDR